MISLQIFFIKSYNQGTRKDARSKCYNCIEYIKKSIFQFICASIIRVACSASPLRLTSVRKSSPDVPFEPLRTAWSSWWGRWAWVLTALGGWPWWSKGLLHDCDEFSRPTIKVTPFQEHECQIAEDPVRPSPQLKRSEQASLYMLFWFCKKKYIYKQSTNNVQILLHWALKEYGCA